MKEPIRKLDGRSEATILKPMRLVVAALILRPVQNPEPEQGAFEVLICQRKPDQPMSLKWEFPGGKIEDGETSEQALIRELHEELGIDAKIGRQVARIRHKYRNGGTIDLQFFVVNEFTGHLENRIFNDMRWSSLAALPSYDFLAADLDLIRDLSEGKLL
ncbi:(deoxy)nucleoside triphosphate pyrophosphohydrolase [Granulicella sp. WH15]|uniref:(deoxy)nucleoside triphosphate pyrophosphohydrolase n=1 Tax=Granulicella sp. WH15 TaxID=2602070 RepID=UPI00136774A5|nr:(deoxy)nucleoside triphosphate pyrophosphohydrolase [Granulicella sp. WH15]QHN02800.1 (deoxy)nucleoside triphosphate pyrophosphohydrolase [Granulicella sp. WH15]